MQGKSCINLNLPNPTLVRGSSNLKILNVFTWYQPSNWNTIIQTSNSQIKHISIWWENHRAKICNQDLSRTVLFIHSSLWSCRKLDKSDAFSHRRTKHLVKYHVVIQTRWTVAAAIRAAISANTTARNIKKSIKQLKCQMMSIKISLNIIELTGTPSCPCATWFLVVANELQNIFKLTQMR